MTYENGLITLNIFYDAQRKYKNYFKTFVIKLTNI